MCPLAITQSAVQQSLSRPQASPGWMQNEEPSAQCRLASHRPEQQSPLPVQALPAVLQLSLSGVQVLSAPQVPLQQASLLVQALPSETHCSAEHLSPAQLSEQQSVPTLHAPPEGEQVVRFETQPEVGSHRPEQQSGPP